MSTESLQSALNRAYDSLWDKRPDETEMDVIRRTVAILYPFVKEQHGQEQPHCITCQCNKLRDTAKRAPDNPQSKTWHW